jgi:hypothetical protein
MPFTRDARQLTDARGATPLSCPPTSPALGKAPPTHPSSPFPPLSALHGTQRTAVVVVPFAPLPRRVPRGGGGRDARGIWVLPPLDPPFGISRPTRNGPLAPFSMTDRRRPPPRCCLGRRSRRPRRRRRRCRRARRTRAASPPRAPSNLKTATTNNTTVRSRFALSRRRRPDGCWCEVTAPSSTGDDATRPLAPFPQADSSPPPPGRGRARSRDDRAFACVRVCVFVFYVRRPCG